VVATPNCQNTAQDVARKPRHACLAQDDLQRDLRASLRRVAQVAGGLPASVAQHTSASLGSGGEDRRGQIPEMVSIHVRPPEVNDRVMPGHWEGNLIKGAGNRSSVRVLVERTTRLVMLAKMPDATAESALAAFTAKLNQIAQSLRKSLTYDQGREMARHRELARNTNIKVYFCDPHSPWQRGNCENTNGLFRQMLPKGTDLSVHDQQVLDSMADLLNNRPHETLDWRTPIQVFRELMTVAAENTDATIQ
jgi:transposase, IS30 family